MPTTSLKHTYKLDIKPGHEVPNESEIPRYVPISVIMLAQAHIMKEFRYRVEDSFNSTSMRIKKNDIFASDDELPNDMKSATNDTPIISSTPNKLVPSSKSDRSNKKGKSKHRSRSSSGRNTPKQIGQKRKAMRSDEVDSPSLRTIPLLPVPAMQLLDDD